jgi:hypothetical protein
MNKDLVNKRNTRDWVKCNEDSRASHWRNVFIEEHGGVFEQEGRQWLWKENTVDTRKKQERKEYIFINKDGVEFLTDNFSKFCRQNDLNKSAMHQVRNGERNHHKGFTVTKLPPKEE